jgi:MFS family permease
MQTTEIQHRTRFQVFTALRHPSFRRFWLGSVASVMGFQIMMVAQGWLVYDLTGSKLVLGYLGLAAGLPAIGLNLFGGVMADKVDQRRLLIITQAASSFVMFILASLVLLDMVQVWHLMSSAFLIGSIQAFDAPTRQAMFPHLIDRVDMMNAVALNSMVWQGTRVIGPALGGLIIGTRLGIAPGFYGAFLGFLVMALIVSTLRLPPLKSARETSMSQDMAQGINFVRTNRIFVFLIGMTFFNSMFGISYIFLFPVFAKDIFEAGTSGLGFLSAATGIGALIGTVFTASLGNFQRKGWLLLAGAVLFGIFLILFAVTSSIFASLPLAMGIIFLAGASTSTYMITVMSTLQTLVPDELRGRVMGIYGMTWSLLPLGAMQAGAIAQFTSAPFAVALGGLAVILFAVGMAVTNSQVRNLGGAQDAVVS